MKTADARPRFFLRRQFAFPRQRKEPLEDASHVRNAIARFNQVEDVSDHERDEAWSRIRAAPKKLALSPLSVEDADRRSQERVG